MWTEEVPSWTTLQRRFSPGLHVQLEHPPHWGPLMMTGKHETQPLIYAIDSCVSDMPPASAVSLAAPAVDLRGEPVK